MPESTTQPRNMTPAPMGVQQLSHCCMQLLQLPYNQAVCCCCAAICPCKPAICCCCAAISCSCADMCCCCADSCCSYRAVSALCSASCCARLRMAVGWQSGSAAQRSSSCSHTSPPEPACSTCGTRRQSCQITSIGTQCYHTPSGYNAEHASLHCDSKASNLACK